MKRLFTATLFLLSMLQLAALAQTTRKAPAKKSSKAVAKKRPAVRKAMPMVDPTVGDNVDGDDLVIRRAAVQALGGYAGSVVAVDPSNGRVLTMVNQKLALQTGFIPCSTIKLVTSLAAITENVIEKNTTLHISRYLSFNMTQALAKSNNQYFNILGTRLGFDRVHHYAEMMGFGEKAGLDIPGEQPGILPDTPPAQGVGMMTSFGSGISMTPMELAALLSAISNGGTLYYLQYPRTEEEAAHFDPKVKRVLALAPNGIDDIKDGMRGAVDYGTARRAGYDATEPILGKTGTCTDFQSANKMGWFGSFNEVGNHRLVVVVMLTGHSNISGPIASGVAGNIYRTLSAHRYFATEATGVPTAAKKKSDLPEIISTTPCCSTATGTVHR